MKIAVKSGKVHVTVPFLNMHRSFEGLLTGDPLGNNEDFQQTMGRIETLIAESQEEPDSDADDNSGDKGFLGSMMGTIGSGHALPESSRPMNSRLLPTPTY